MAAQLWNLFTFAQANVLEERGNLRAKAAYGLLIFLDDIAQDIADFRLHALAMPVGAPAQASFDFGFNAANENLGHAATCLCLSFVHIAAIVIAYRMCQPRRQSRLA